MRSIVEDRAGPYIALAALVIFPLGGVLTSGTEWGRGGTLFYFGLIVEGTTAALCGLALYRLYRIYLRKYPSEVWFSTKSQFDAFDEALSKTSSFGKAIGRFSIRPGAAYVTSPMPWMKIPMVLVAWGEVSTDADRLSFSPIKRSDRDRLRRNVMQDFSFDLPFSEIEKVEPYERPTSSFGLPWTRVVTSRPAPLNDFLLSVGGRDAYGMAGYRLKALELRATLQHAVRPH
jgi:hypothetical protein